MENKKYYWLKLKRDFFKQHDVRVVEQMPNGKDYILFYLKLLCESLSHQGNLRFSDQIPYNAEMLATITYTNVDVVRGAIKVFTELGMIDLLDDGTIYMQEVEKMMGGETKWAEQKRKQRGLPESANGYRKFDTDADIVHQMSTKCPQNVLNDNNNNDIYLNYRPITINNNKEKEKNTIKKEKENLPQNPPNSRQNFKKPTIDEVKEYIQSKNYHFDAEAFWHFYESKGWVVGKAKMKNWHSACATWEKSRKNDVRSKPVKGNDFHQRSYDFDALEKQLITNVGREQK